MIKECNPEFEVQLAYLPSQALEIINDVKGAFDIIFLDFNMPEMNGLELAEKLNEYYPNEKIVMLTATSAFATRSKSLPEGMRLIQKPLSVDKLKEALTDNELLASA